MKKYRLILSFSDSTYSVTNYKSYKNRYDEFKEVKEKIEDYNQFVLSEIKKKPSIYTKLITFFTLEEILSCDKKDENATRYKGIILI